MSPSKDAQAASDSSASATPAEVTAYSTQVMRQVSRIGVRTLRVNNHGLFFIRLQNRTCDVEYQISPLRVPAWLKHLGGV